MYKQFANPSETNISMSRLRLEPVVNQSAVQNKLNVLAKRNLKRQQMFDRLKFKPIRITRPNIENVWNNPLAHSVPVQSDGQEISEILRMAKVLAFKTREIFPNSPEDYNREMDRFMRDYSAKISKYNLYTKLVGIFNLYRDPNYSEPMFDKDYIKQTTSNDYIKSVNEKLKSVKEARSAIEAVGGASGVVTSMDPTELLGGVKDWSGLASSTKLKKYTDADPKLQELQKKEEEKLETLLKEKERIITTFTGLPEKAEAVDEVNRRIAEQQKAVESIIALRDKYKYERRSLRDEIARAKREEEERARKEAEAKKLLDEEAKRKLKEDTKRAEEEAKRKREDDARKASMAGGSSSSPRPPVPVTPSPSPTPPTGGAGAGAGSSAGSSSSYPSTLAPAEIKAVKMIEEQIASADTEFKALQAKNQEVIAKMDKEMNATKLGRLSDEQASILSEMAVKQRHIEGLNRQREMVIGGRIKVEDLFK